MCRTQTLIAAPYERRTPNPSGAMFGATLNTMFGASTDAVPPAAEGAPAWRCVLRGPPHTAYEGGAFALRLSLPPTFPYCPPRVRFATPIHHPNIAPDGAVCLDLLTPTGWSPSTTLPSMLLSLQQLLASPNADDALVGAVARQYTHARAAFEKWCAAGSSNTNRACTAQHAAA